MLKQLRPEGAHSTQLKMRQFIPIYYLHEYSQHGNFPALQALVSAFDNRFVELCNSNTLERFRILSSIVDSFPVSEYLIEDSEESSIFELDGVTQNSIEISSDRVMKHLLDFFHSRNGVKFHLNSFKSRVVVNNQLHFYNDVKNIETNPGQLHWLLTKTRMSNPDNERYFFHTTNDNDPTTFSRRNGTSSVSIKPLNDLTAYERSRHFHLAIKIACNLVNPEEAKDVWATSSFLQSAYWSLNKNKYSRLPYGKTYVCRLDYISVNWIPWMYVNGKWNNNMKNTYHHNGPVKVLDVWEICAGRNGNWSDIGAHISRIRKHGDMNTAVMNEKYIMTVSGYTRIM